MPESAAGTVQGTEVTSGHATRAGERSWMLSAWDGMIPHQPGATSVRYMHTHSHVLRAQGAGTGTKHPQPHTLGWGHLNLTPLHPQRLWRGDVPACQHPPPLCWAAWCSPCSQRSRRGARRRPSAMPSTHAVMLSLPSLLIPHSASPHVPPVPVPSPIP